MSSLVTVPKAHVANISEIADFTELECLRTKDGNVSTLDISRMMQREVDASDDNEVAQPIAEAFDECTARCSDCGSEDGRYPYEVLEHGTLLQLRSPINVGTDERSALLYIFLLLATRMNMQTQRSQGGEDATKLFEYVCTEIAERYWGGPNSATKSIVFGTGARNGINTFKRKIEDLCSELNEGYGFQADRNATISAQDGKLDLVVWKKFTDSRPGQLIGFGQCKTGQHWQRDLAQLNPNGFCRKWMVKPPAVDPVALFFVTDRATTNFYDLCVDGGILFDRCRVVEFANDLSKSLLVKLSKWVKAAMKLEGLKLP